MRVNSYIKVKANLENSYLYLNQRNMKHEVFLRKYPVEKEPSIFNPKSWVTPSEIEIQKIFDFFQNDLGLETSWKSLGGNKHIEGIFCDENRRVVKLRYYFMKGIYRNIIIDDNLNNVKDIKTFKKLWERSPHIKV